MRQAGRACCPNTASSRKPTRLSNSCKTPSWPWRSPSNPCAGSGLMPPFCSATSSSSRGLGQTYHFRETGGVVMDFAVTSAADIARLSVEHVVESFITWTRPCAPARRTRRPHRAHRFHRLALDAGHVHDGRRQRPPNTAAPWPCSRAENGLSAPGGKAHRRRHRLFADANRGRSGCLADFRQPRRSPAHRSFRTASGRWMRDIIPPWPAPGQPPPVIVFSLGTHASWPDLIATGANVIGVDWQTSLAEARKRSPRTSPCRAICRPALIWRKPRRRIVAAKH
jgi:hypothetical protein